MCGKGAAAILFVSRPFLPNSAVLFVVLTGVKPPAGRQQV